MDRISLREEEPRTCSSLFGDMNKCEVPIPLEEFWEYASVGEGGGKHEVSKFLKIQNSKEEKMRA